jgi:hypothetical protein
MPLDIELVAAQIEAMATDFEAERRERDHRLSFALKTLRSQATDLDSLRAKIMRSRTTWLVAGIGDGLVECHRPPPTPADFVVAATDGSQIDVDRHGPVRCYLINVGSVLLRYGRDPEAVLRSRPVLYSGKEDLTIADPLGSGEQPVQGGLLGIKRAVSECRALADLADELPPDIPRLALLDGSLIMWGLAGKAYDEYVKDELLVKGFLPELDRMRSAGRTTGLAMASYISSTGSTELVNMLRIAVCPHETPDCDRFCARNRGLSQKECESVAGLRDSSLMTAMLKPGERSATFISRSSVVTQYYGEHEIRYFYLNVEGEIARVEIPRWVEEGGLVDLVHTLVLDQCGRGHGYPVALSEAHEQAVVNASDREQFQRLVELALSERRVPTMTSAKSRSKRSRWV